MAGRHCRNPRTRSDLAHLVSQITLILVKIKVNGTTEEDDDFVPVSDEFTTGFSVKVSGMDGLTADLAVKGADGGLQFEQQTVGPRPIWLLVGFNFNIDAPGVLWF